MAPQTPPDPKSAFVPGLPEFSIGHSRIDFWWNFPGDLQRNASNHKTVLMCSNHTIGESQFVIKMMLGTQDAKAESLGAESQRAKTLRAQNGNACRIL